MDSQMINIRDELTSKAAIACGSYPQRVFDAHPLVHMITNYVTVTDCVNAVLAIGGRGICSHAPQEAASVTKGADALVLNLGGTEFYDAMELSAIQALKSGIPLVIDPVGCAASDFRREKCLEFTLKYHPAAIRGNYAEIEALINLWEEKSKLGPGYINNPDDEISETPDFKEVSQCGAAGRKPAGKDERVLYGNAGSAAVSQIEIKKREDDAYNSAKNMETDDCSASKAENSGLDSAGSLDEVQSRTLHEKMIKFSRETKVMLIASGATDICTDGITFKEVTCGTPALRRITGAGCLSTSVLAAYLAVENTLESAASAVSYIGLAGEAAYNAAKGRGFGAGHFHMFFMDALSAADPLWRDKPQAFRL